MKLVYLFLFCLCLVLPLSSAITFNEAQQLVDEPISTDIGDVYVIVPEKTYWNEEFSFIVGIATNTNSESASFEITGLSEAITPISDAITTDRGGSFYSEERLITPLKDEVATLTVYDENNEVIFTSNYVFEAAIRIPVTSDILSSEEVPIELVASDSNVANEARTSLSVLDQDFSPMEFTFMQNKANEEFSSTKIVEKINETYDDNSSAIKTKVTISVVSLIDNADGVDIIEVIDKSVVSDAKFIRSIPQAFVLKADPVIMWHITESEDEVSYEIADDVDVTGNTVLVSGLTADDSSSSRKFPWRVLGPLAIIPLVAGVIVFFARFEPKKKHSKK